MSIPDDFWDDSESICKPKELVDLTKFWSVTEAVELCTLIQSVSPNHNCHPALTGGLLYKTGLRKDCDIVIYQRGDTDGVRPPINWDGLWFDLVKIGLDMNVDYGYVKKCVWRGKTVDIFDPTKDGGDYGSQQA